MIVLRLKVMSGFRLLIVWYSFATTIAWMPTGAPFHLAAGQICLNSAKSESAVSEDEGNIFHQYDKPVLVIGCSGPGDELRRIAEGFLGMQDTSGHEANVVELSSIDDKGEVILEGDQVIRLVEEKSFGWPNIILVDFGGKGFSEEADKLEQHYTESIKSLYADHDILSIFVNVHPEDGKMESEVRQRKAKIEEGVLLKYSDYELCVRDEGVSEGSENWDHVQWEFTRLIARARLTPPIPGDTTRSANSAHLTMGLHTFFLSLSFPEIHLVEPYVEEMCKDVDAMEYRTDLLDCRDSRFDIIYGMQLLRRYCRPHVVRVPALSFGRNVIEDVIPIVYTVRTEHQAGTYPDDKEGIDQMFDMLEWGLRAGSEVLDVESAWDKAKTDNLLSLSKLRYSSQILGSHHVVGKEITTQEAVELFRQCALDGRAHGAKVVLSIESEDKDRMAYEAATIASSLAQSSNQPVIPNISLILGDVGKFSRVLNFPFTPVTHESLPFKAAPGQMSASELMTTRLLTNVFDKKVYAILGHKISYSVSPQMQGGAFGATRLPHKYLRADVETVEEFVEGGFFLGDDFGGCSVTIPHKQSILPYVDILSDAVKEIGSCNTLIVKQEVDEENDCMKRVIYGDNTDWKGIFNPLNRLLGGQVDRNSDHALILGAGGTARAAAYVASKLGLKRVYYNRTPEKARDLVDSFGGIVASTLDNTSDEASVAEIMKHNGGNVRVVISTLPAAAKFVLPEWLIASRPIVFDVNYKPYETDLLRQAEDHGCALVRGSEMLWEQGIGQFELWTERTAPYGVMKQIVLANC